MRLPADTSCMTTKIADGYRTSPEKVFRYASDKQNHFSAFDFDLDGKLTIGELAKGFEVLGNSPAASKFKATFARMFFGSDLSKVTSKGDGFYDRSGNVDTAKVHEVFQRYTKNGVLTQDDVNEVVAGFGFKDRLTKKGQYGSAFKLQSGYTEDQFVELLKGHLLRDKFLERMGQ